jgi:hypothetical protein
MNKKLNWLNNVTQNIGLLEIIPIILGVPPIVIIIITIWHNLSFDEKIIVSIMSGLIVIAIFIFVYSQKRKILYKIPNLLYERFDVARKYSSCINIINLNEEDFYRAYKLVGIDFKNVVSAGNLDEFRNKIEALYSKVEKQGIPDKDSELFCSYLQKKLVYNYYWRKTNHT